MVHNTPGHMKCGSTRLGPGPDSRIRLFQPAPGKIYPKEDLFAKSRLKGLQSGQEKGEQPD